MNILKHLRKPYFSIFLATLVLFVSCSQYDNIELEEKSLTLEEYTENNMEIINQMTYILSREKNIDVDKLMNPNNSVKTQTDLETIYSTAGIEASDKMYELTIDLIDNVAMLMNNDNYNHLTEQELITLITNEIEYQFLDDSTSKSSACQDTFEIAKDRCYRNYAIAVAAAAVSAFWSFGVGTLIGLAAASAVAVNCSAEALSDYNNCMGFDQ